MTDEMIAPGEGPSVSLVLGSGGARGLAHIGVIERLEAAGYRIESIAGSSMGALIGGIYAAGELASYRSWVCALSSADVLRFLDFAFSGRGLFKGDRIMDTLRAMVGEHAIEDLPISYTAVAVDIDRQREVWFSKGALFDAIRASIAVPSIFTPFEHRGMTLLDGGLINPVPIAPTFRDLTDITIAVNLNGQPPPHRHTPVAAGRGGRPERGGDGYQARIGQFLDRLGENLLQPDEGELGMFDLLSRSFETMQNAIAAVKLAAYKPDVLIQVPRDACAAHEFHRAAEMIDLGRRLAEEALAGRASGRGR